MIKVDYLLLCEKALQSENNSFSLINIFNTISPDSYPASIKDFTIAFNLVLDKETLDKEKVDVDIDITDHKGNPIFGLKGKAVRNEDTPNDILKAEVDVSKIKQVTFPKAGKYYVKMSIDSEMIASREFSLLKEGK